MYKNCLLILFGCLTSLATINVHFFTEEFRICYSIIHCVSIYRVNRWQKKYFTILDFTMEIDGFFGPMAVIFIAHIFIKLIVNIGISTGILISLKEGTPILFFIGICTMYIYMYISNVYLRCKDSYLEMKSSIERYSCILSFHTESSLIDSSSRSQ